MPLITRIGGMAKKIRDATALPEDVLSGKIFYNNQGRQVGRKIEPIITRINLTKNQKFDITGIKTNNVREIPVLEESNAKDINLLSLNREHLIDISKVSTATASKGLNIFTESLLLNKDIKIVLTSGSYKATVRLSRANIINGMFAERIKINNSDMSVAVNNNTDYTSVLNGYLLLNFNGGCLNKIGICTVSDSLKTNLTTGTILDNLDIEISGHYEG